MEAFEEFTHAGMTVKLMYDEVAGNPYTEHEQLSKVLAGPRLAGMYDVGEEWERLDDFESVEAAKRYLTLMEGYLVAIPFTFNDYGSSGARVDLVDTSSDSAAGFLVVTLKAARHEAPDSTDRAAMREWAETTARAEFGEFKAWVEGEAMGWAVEAPNGETLESCWGYYGEVDYVMGQARAAAVAAAQIYVEQPPRKPILVELEQTEAAAMLFIIRDSKVLTDVHHRVAHTLAGREQEEAAALERVQAAMAAARGDTWTIRSNDEHGDDGERLYWSNEQGWVDVASATAFTRAERDSFNLPLGNCEWVDAAAKVTA